MSLADAEEAQHLNEVVYAFRNYHVDMLSEIAKRERNVWIHGDLVHLLPGGKDGLAQRLDQQRAAVRANQALFDRMVETNHFTSADVKGDVEPSVSAQIRNMSKVRSTLHQCAREWSLDGSEERDKAFVPLLDYLERYVPQDKNKKVLVPGCGLGRLPVEVIGRGYSCQGNEFSYQMLLMCELLLNQLNSSDPSEQVKVCPWIHNPSNHKDSQDLVREVSIPDKSALEIISAAGDKAGELSMNAGDFVEIYSKPMQLGQWDSVITCFFVDTASNPLEYLKVIHGLLKPGGAWINGGPLLWHWQSSGPKSSTTSSGEQDKRYRESVELTYDQLKHLAEQVGFDVKEERWEQVGYTSNPRSMMRTVYEVVQFVAIKK